MKRLSPTQPLLPCGPFPFLSPAQTRSPVSFGPVPPRRPSPLHSFRIPVRPNRSRPLAPAAPRARLFSLASQPHGLAPPRARTARSPVAASRWRADPTCQPLSARSARRTARARFARCAPGPHVSARCRDSALARDPLLRSLTAWTHQSGLSSPPRRPR